ncbi:unnamed protein product [Scytosiphon promiscuus]
MMRLSRVVFGYELALLESCLWAPGKDRANFMVFLSKFFRFFPARVLTAAAAAVPNRDTHEERKRMHVSYISCNVKTRLLHEVASLLPSDLASFVSSFRPSRPVGRAAAVFVVCRSSVLQNSKELEIVVV